MRIGPLASAQVLTVGPEHNLLDTARKMRENNVGSAVVLTDEGYPGIITERDLLRAVSDGADLAATPVREYMTSTPITATEAWDVVDAARAMKEGGFRHLLVLDDDRRVAGMLSIRDLVVALLEDRERILSSSGLDR